MKFKISGEVKLGTQSRKFAKEIDAESENLAKERVFSLLGAQNGVRRTSIKISGIAKA